MMNYKKWEALETGSDDEQKEEKQYNFFDAGRMVEEEFRQKRKKEEEEIKELQKIQDLIKLEAEKLAEENVAQVREKMKRPLVFLDISMNDKLIGRFVLLTDITPITCENFRCLCTGEKGKSPRGGTLLHYKNTKIHKISKDFLIQAGDIVYGNGTGGDSIYGHTFEDENFVVPHDRIGQISMANAGNNSNGSQFIISYCAHQSLNNRHVVFARILKGIRLLHFLNSLPTEPETDKPNDEILISDCGELGYVDLKDVNTYQYLNFDNTIDSLDIYPDTPVNTNYAQYTIEEKVQAVENIRQAGNFFYKKALLDEARFLYDKALEYASEAWVVSDEDWDKLSAISVPVYLNKAIMANKAKDWDKVISECNKALEIQKDNVKGLYHRGGAYIEKKEEEKAIVDLAYAHRLSPDDKNIKIRLDRAKKLKNDQMAKESAIFKKAFQNLNLT